MSRHWELDVFILLFVHDYVDNKSLFRFVAESTCLIRSGRTSRSVDNIELTILPATDAQEKPQNIRLIVLVQLRIQLTITTDYLPDTLGTHCNDDLETENVDLLRRFLKPVPYIRRSDQGLRVIGHIHDQHRIG